jgi:hypothetical protein
MADLRKPGLSLLGCGGCSVPCCCACRPDTPDCTRTRRWDLTRAWRAGRGGLGGSLRRRQHGGQGGRKRKAPVAHATRGSRPAPASRSVAALPGWWPAPAAVRTHVNHTHTRESGLRRLLPHRGGCIGLTWTWRAYLCRGIADVRRADEVQLPPRSGVPQMRHRVIAQPRTPRGRRRPRRRQQPCSARCAGPSVQVLVPGGVGIAVAVVVGHDAGRTCSGGDDETIRECTSPNICYEDCSNHEALTFARPPATSWSWVGPLPPRVSGVLHHPSRRRVPA